MALATYAVANALLLERYLRGRVPLSLALTLTYVAGLVAVPWVLRAVPQRWLGRVVAGVCTAVVLVGATVLVAVDPDDLDVDRWSAVTAFWDAAFRGDYPYSAPSHLGGYSGQFPFFFLFALPFRLTREVGLLPLAAWLGFVGAVWRWADRRSAAEVAVLGLGGAAMWWEVGTRSNLFANMALAVAVVAVTLRWRPATSARALVLGLAAGLVASTRGIVALPLAALVASVFLWSPVGDPPLPLGAATRRLAAQRMARLAVYVGAAVAAFVATFVPLLAWGFGDLREYNPFAFQARFVPWWGYGVALAASVLWCGRSPRLAVVAARSGVLVLAVVGVHLAIGIADVGLDAALEGGEIDVSYVAFALPLALTGLTRAGDG